MRQPRGANFSKEPGYLAMQINCNAVGFASVNAKYMERVHYLFGESATPSESAVHSS